MNPKKQAQFDRALAEIREMTPGSWWALYSGSVEKGFSPTQAMDLLRSYIFASQGCPVFLTSPPSPEGDDDEAGPS